MCWPTSGAPCTTAPGVCEHLKEKLQQRQARLAGGVAQIRVQKSLENLEPVNEDQAIGTKILAPLERTEPDQHRSE